MHGQKLAGARGGDEGRICPVYKCCTVCTEHGALASSIGQLPNHQPRLRKQHETAALCSGIRAQNKHELAVDFSSTVPVKPPRPREARVGRDRQRRVIGTSSSSRQCFEVRLQSSQRSLFWGKLRNCFCWRRHRVRGLAGEVEAPLFFLKRHESPSKGGRMAAAPC